MQGGEWGPGSRLAGRRWHFSAQGHLRTEPQSPLGPALFTHPCAPKLQPECQEEEDGGGRMRSLSSCICRRMGRRSPQEMFSSPSTMNSSSSCPQSNWHHEPALKTPQKPAAHRGTMDSAPDTSWLGAPKLHPQASSETHPTANDP